MDKRKILILTADAGFGHRSTANALGQAFALRYGEQAEVAIVNPLDDRRAPFFLRSAESDYDKLAREWPEFYKLGYRLSDLAMTTNVTEMAYVVMMYDVMARLIKQQQPDVVVVTFPTYQYPFEMVRRLNRTDTPMATVVTDLVSLQRMWFSKGADLCLVPSDVAAKLALQRGLDPEVVHMTGLPVNPALSEAPASKAEARRALGWAADKFTLLAVGSKRVEGLDRFLHVLNHSGFDLQLIAVAGGSDELYETLRSTEWHLMTHVYNFVDNMPTFLQAADCVLSKAGGLIVTESLACALPMFIMQVIPGQETGNAELMVQEGAGELTLQPLELLEGLAHWLADDRALYAERASNARRLGRPEAAFTAADLIWDLAAARRRRPSRLSVPIEEMKDLLRQFGSTAAG